MSAGRLYIDSTPVSAPTCTEDGCTNALGGRGWLISIQQNGRVRTFAEELCLPCVEALAETLTERYEATSEDR